MAIPDRDTSRREAGDESKDLPPPDRDQWAGSAARAQDKADEAEAAAQRRLPGETSTPDGQPLTSRGHLQGENAGGASAESAAQVASDDRNKRIADRAYYKAERRGFAPGGEGLDWLESEREEKNSGG